ncbi:MAG: class I SAM-dependent DNA methyltransferase [Alphaproteobacteria bacterium]
MSLSWNEIRDRSIEFQKEWENAGYEKGETQSFYNDFFQVFGVNRRRVASFEEPVKKLGDKRGFIDLFWKGKLLVEQKSKGRDLKKAKEQALDYFPNLKDTELPRYILLSDFQNFEFYDLEEDTEYNFPLKEFSKNIHLFGFIIDRETYKITEQEEINIKASELLGNLFDELKTSGYREHDIELFLVRVLFCLFAEDTEIFNSGQFTQFIEKKTNIDGADLGSKLVELFQVLNTHENKRNTNLDDDLNAFCYINGSLFETLTTIPSFNSSMRKALLKCCHFDWSKISPAIFGSLFQSVSNPEKRRTLGEHYTSEKNILKTIKPLFLDDLWAEFKKNRNNRNKLKEFHKKISKLKFLDPACGCGNFLVISYREIRRLEIEVLKELGKEKKQFELDTKILSLFDVDNFYGIEIEEFPAKIAEVAMWLTDHQMNLELSKAFGKYYARIPLKKSAKIINKNALRFDWTDIVKPSELSYILGNPPFIGKQEQEEEQKKDIEFVFNNFQNAGVLDYVCCWYIKSAQYIKGTNIKVGFVSTNSITQGEQVGILWNELLNKYKIKIHFAHRTFAWDNEARGKAKVHCVVIGFANFDTKNKTIFDYPSSKSDPIERKAKNINPYLVDYKDTLLLSRNSPICNIPEIVFGNMPNDGGNFLFTEEEKKEFIKKEPKAKKYIKHFLSAKEFINGINRYCLWLVDATPQELKEMPLVMERINKIKNRRTNSTRKETKLLAEYPTKFGEIRQPQKEYILIPRHSSERRKYIPLGFFKPNFIVADSCACVPNANLYHFGILTSKMHMTWTQAVCGRLKSDYRYSNTIVYNNYPFPKEPTNKAVKKVEEKAQKILDVRKKYNDCSLATLYDPNFMPPDLVKAHNELDKAVDACYGFKKETDLERISFLFELYEEYTCELLSKTKKQSKSKP